jgi:hypothetical protein
MPNRIGNPIRAKDFIAPALVWALVLTGCIIGDVKPVHSDMARNCPPAFAEHP